MSRWALVAVVAACTVGPAYHRPRAPLPAADAYKEWKLATPRDGIPRGHWWTMFHDPELDRLVARLNVNNQNILLAMENYLAAAALVRVARAGYFPTVTVAPTVTLSRGGGARGVTTGPSVTTPTTGTGTTGTGTTGTTGTGTTTTGTTTTTTAATAARRTAFYSLPIEATWVPDLFGRVRNMVRQNQYTAQARAADLENVRLVQQSLLAQTFFELRGQDALIAVLEDTVKSNEEIVNLTIASYNVGISNEAEVLQAQLTLQTARVQLTNAGVARAQFEHAIASLIGVPASSFSLPRRALHAAPPAIPPGTPSQLLERRPDIASAERAMAAANAAIGVGYAAYFPVLTLTGDAGFSSTTLRRLLSFPNRFWAIGATLVETLFDGGLRRATVDQAWAAYFATVATYRQTVLTAFQQVEDQLAALRILAVAIEEQRTAVQIAERSVEIERARYATGLDPYVTLMTQQIALLQARQTLVTLEIQQMTAAVLLIQFLGGGWGTDQLPTPGEVTRVRPYRR